MDNLTHTLIGLIAGESVAQSAGVRGGGLPARTKRSLLIALVAIGSNLPDLDLILSYRGFARGKLDYMLGHRGYTHTIAGCVLLAVMLYGGAHLWMRRRRLSALLAERFLLAGAALLGTALHLGMDFLNSYGVHPFWPVENRWYYGDSIFIVEPLYWVAAAPLFFVQRSWPARALLALSVLAAIALSVLSGLVPALMIVTLIAFAALLASIGSRSPPRVAAAVSLASYALITVVFIGCGRLAVANAAALPPFGRVLDRALTPMPANPICWDLLLLQEEGGHYRVRHAVVSVAPGLIAAAACPKGMSSGQTTARLVPVSAEETRSVHWIGELQLPSDSFALLAARYCDAAALMRFARVPFVSRVTADQGHDGGTVIGDLRFDRERGLGFSELLLPDRSAPESGASPRCNPTPPWTPPRSDLLTH